MVDVDKVATQLESMVKDDHGSASKDDLKTEVERILSDAGVTTDAERVEIKVALRTKFQGMTVTTTGACYYKVSGNCYCRSGLTQSQCDAIPGTFYAGQSCKQIRMFDVLEEEGLG